MQAGLPSHPPSRLPATSPRARAAGALLALLATVATPSTATAAPDLVLEAVVLDPTSVANGGSVDITVTVANRGDAPSAESRTRVRINQSAEAVVPTDTALCNVVTAPIAPGASLVLECSATIVGRPSGTNQVWGIADSNGTSGETDTTNNRLPTPLEVTSEAADLVVDSITLTPPMVANGESFTVEAVIRNAGSVQASASTTRVRINQDATTVGPTDPVLCNGISTPTIAPGASVEVSCRPTLEARPSGTNQVWVLADVNRTAGQSDLANDRLATPLEVEFEVPDLVVGDLSVSPSRAPNGRAISIAATVSNRGLAASAPSVARLLLGASPDGITPEDVVLCEAIAVPALDVNAGSRVKCSPVLVGIQPGAYFLRLLADATGEAGQLVRTNDTSTSAFTVTSEAPDLVVENVVVDPAFAVVGSAVVVTAEVRNQGTADAAASTTRVRAGQGASAPGNGDAVLCDAIPTAALKVGAKAAVRCEATTAALAPGEWKMWVTADATNSAGQLSRTNDHASAAHTVKPPDAPDLAVTSLSVSPTSGPDGTRVVATVVLANVGTLASSPSTTHFRINRNALEVFPGDSLLCPPVATPSLPVGGKITLRCRTRIEDRPEGQHFVWVVADATTTAGQAVFANDRERASFTVSSSTCGAGDDAPVLAWPIEQPRVVQDHASYGAAPVPGGGRGYHAGLDLVSGIAWPNGGAPVFAAAPGEIVLAKRGCASPASAEANPPRGKCNGGWGNFVVVRHGGGVATLYAHLASVDVVDGCVEAGQRLGLAGASGFPGMPPHLHFGVVGGIGEVVKRKHVGAHYYRRHHPLDARFPETTKGSPRTHPDPRDLFPRSRVRLLEATSIARTRPGSAPAFGAKSQQVVSYGELTPGFLLVDLPDATLPSVATPRSDDLRYGWLEKGKAAVVGEATASTTARVDGFRRFLEEGAGPGFVALRGAADADADEITKAWDGQFLVVSGEAAVDEDTLESWLPVFVPGTSASGPGQPRRGWIPAARVGSSTPGRPLP